VANFTYRICIGLREESTSEGSAPTHTTAGGAVTGREVPQRPRNLCPTALTGPPLGRSSFMEVLTSNKLSRYLSATVAFVLLLSEPPLSSSDIEGSTPAVYLSIFLSIFLSSLTHPRSSVRRSAQTRRSSILPSSEPPRSSFTNRGRTPAAKTASFSVTLVPEIG
jgi:hypothetical protein